MASSALEPIDVDNIIEKLLSVRGARPGKQVNLSETEIRGLCLHAREVFLAQPILVELEAPIKICGAFVAGLFCMGERMDGGAHAGV